MEETFGERLKRLRKSKGLTQRQISEKLNVHERTISKWERNISEPDMSVFCVLSKTLGVSLEEIWGVSCGKIVENGRFDPVCFGKTIASERKKIKESQNSLAAAVRVSSDTVSKWERGVVCPDLTTFLSLAEHFQVSPSEFYYAVEDIAVKDTAPPVETAEVTEVTAETTFSDPVPLVYKKRKRIFPFALTACAGVLLLTMILFGALKPFKAEQPGAIVGCSHSYEQTVTAATCTEQGYTTYVCVDCGDRYETNYTPLVSHTAGEWITDKEATCTFEGSRHNECTVCGKLLETQIIEKSAHSYEQTVTAATCTEQGYTTYICEKCGDRYETNYTPLVSHTAGEWITDKEATCTLEGSRHNECTVCGKLLETQIIEKSAHSYEQTVTAATCTEQGYTTYICEKCGDRYETNYTPLLSHTAGEWITDKEATCTLEGSRHNECTVCGKHLETQVIEKSAHSYEQTLTAATCTEQGYTTYVCGDCGESYKTNYTPLVSHTAGEWITDKEATCTLEGSRHNECTVCGKLLETQIIKKSTHSYEQIVTAATCTEQGYTTYVCVDCGESYKTNYTPLVSHTAGEWITDKEATCTLGGG